MCACDDDADAAAADGNDDDDDDDKKGHSEHKHICPSICNGSCMYQNGRGDVNALVLMLLCGVHNSSSSNKW